ncbi:iron-sulfur cluster repair di-iron protein [Brevibacillus migulae]|uniref:iron-sulfur cluster repair di-iron protein n=1 Tax=Brevibacillus migulae TaxID=1644114 RepID=UPI00106EB778|nr:iron-sulfur cluster repair di-iron protein [Brevibacillus migulae]
MERIFTGSDVVGEIVAAYPGATNLFAQYKIDFCCGGNRSLSSALQQKKIDEASFLTALNAAYQNAHREDHGTDWRVAPYPELIDHIVTKHHGYLLTELPLLSEFVTKVMRVHGPEHPELARLHHLFHQFKMELETHMMEEEQLVFPKIIEYAESGSQDVLKKAADMIEKLEAEHRAAGELLREMREVTQDYQLPPGACRTYTVTFQKLAELEADMFQHVHLENNIMFPRVIQEAGGTCGC